MKKSLLTVSALLLILGASSCVKEYTCTCTYVYRPDPFSPGVTFPNRTETSTTEARIIEDAEFNCDELENKYFSQNYDGSCTAAR